MLLTWTSASASEQPAGRVAQATDPGDRSSGAPFSRFAELARTHRGRPAAEILPLLAHAADRALLGFSGADLWEQACAISDGEPYVLRVTVT
ncbi:hypothetical protein AB0D46_32395 [Streptomyces sp. NPDC048383]|uniref:hypothetical protein n=1 Tax=Streptomyces sp. NPDC048383 TaxID=3155386 RepID=UPI00343C4ADF